MGLEQILSNLPVVLIPIALVVYYTNQNNIKWMAERKELIEALMLERKQLIDWQSATIAQLFQQQERRHEIQERMSLAIEAVKTELHHLRGKIQEVMGRYELIATPKRGKDDDK